MKKNNLTEGGGSDSLAFTLAEVLITLAIIGTVAALTIPTVVRNYQKQETVVRLKKTYSALANTTNLAIADNGPVTGWEIEHYNVPGASLNFANKYLIPYLKVSKNCENKTTAECEFKYTIPGGESFSYGSSYARFYLTDGTLIVVLPNSGESAGLTYKHAIIAVDLNGQKKPNLRGRDIFYFRYYIYYETDNNYRNGKFVPYGYNWSRASLITTGCASGESYSLCAGLIARDGWQIKDDYPW